MEKRNDKRIEEKKRIKVIEVKRNEENEKKRK